MSAIAIESYTVNDMIRVHNEVEELILATLGSLSERDVNSIERSVVLIDRKMTSLRQQAHVGNFAAGLVQQVNPDWVKQVRDVCVCIQQAYKMINQHRAPVCHSSTSGLQRCTSFDELVQHTLTNCG
jgi:hypothetical protein